MTLPAESDLRIAVASSGLGHVARGVESWAAGLADALHSRGVQVGLYQGGGQRVARYATVLPSLTRVSRANAFWSKLVPPGLNSLQRGYALEQSSFAFRLGGALRRERWDILHVQDPIVALQIERLRRMGWHSTRTVLAHGTEEPPEFLGRFPFVQHLAPAHAESCQRAGIAAPDWTTIPNFVDTARFHPGSAPHLRRELRIRDDALVLVSVAAIKRDHKRIDWLIHAVAQFRHSHPEQPVVLVIAGGREAETEAIVAEGRARLGDAVRFLVDFPHARIPELLRASNVFVLSSLFEMMPIALLEAGATALPCMVHRERTLHWITGNGGIPVAMEDTDSFVSTLRFLAVSPSERGNRGAAIREHVVAHFSTPVVIGQVVEYYRRVRG